MNNGKRYWDGHLRRVGDMGLAQDIPFKVDSRGKQQDESTSVDMK